MVENEKDAWMYQTPRARTAARLIYLKHTPRVLFMQAAKPVGPWPQNVPFH